MRVSLAGSRRMDWDELLCGEVPVVGRDFEVLLLVQGLELWRGPMGSLERVGDDVRVRPEVFVRRWAGHASGILVPTDEAASVSVGLTCHRALLLPDTSIVIVDYPGSDPVYRLCAPGDNVLSSPAFGDAASD